MAVVTWMRRAWDSKEYPVLPEVTGHTVRDHLVEYHGFTAGWRAERADLLPNGVVLANHHRMHELARDRLVDGHFHGVIDPEEDRPLDPAPEPTSGPMTKAVADFADRASEVVVDHYEEMAEDWKAFIEAIGDPDRWVRRSGVAALRRSAYRYVMVNLFGDEAKYLTDPEFHAKVALGGQMLQMFEQAMREAELEKE